MIRSWRYVKGTTKLFVGGMAMGDKREESRVTILFSVRAGARMDLLLAEMGEEIG